MRNLATAAAALILCFCQLALAHEIQGEWKYSSFIYDGQTHPILTPTLDLRFWFSADGISTLRWFESDQAGFCERKAYYVVEEGNTLYQKVFWVNPDNHSSCSSDPDMQMGRENRTTFKIENQKLMFDLQLNGQPFIYIMDRISDRTEQEK
jgi:hypothetical protein